MKRIYTLLLACLPALFAAEPLAAQMLPDSTVQVVAYWEVGDRMDYTYLERQYSLDAEGNETQTSSSSETLRFEVVAATDSTYTLEIRSDDLFSTNLEFNLTPQERAAMPNEVPYRIKTSHLGTFLGLENAEEVLSEMERCIPIIAKAVWRTFDKEQQKAVDEKQLQAYLRNALTSPETINRMCIEEIAPLFFYHGARLDTTQVFSFRNTYENLIGDGDATLETHFRVDPELTDDYSVVMRMETYGGEEELVPLVRDYGFTLASQLNTSAGETLSDSDYEEYCRLFEEALRDNPVEASFEEYITEEIHLGSGWPIQWLFDRYVVFSQGETFNGAHITREIHQEDKIGGE